MYDLVNFSCLNGNSVLQECLSVAASLCELVQISYLDGRPQFGELTDALPEERQFNDSSIIVIKTISDNSTSAEYYSGEDKASIRILPRVSNKPGYVAEFADQDIIFPDSYQVIFESSLRINGSPKCAESSTFCEDFPQYPYRQIKDALRRKQVRNDFFGRDESPEGDGKFNISNRVGEIEEFVCASYQRTVFPKVAKNKNNKWKFIINQEESDGYIQGVRIETCRQEGVSCSIIGELATGYTTSCKQKYIYRRLMSLNDNGDPVPETFQLPSACCCAYRRNVDFFARFGAQVTPAFMPKSKVKG